MKKRISAKSKEKIIVDYPIHNLLQGWFFKYWEKSNGYYIVEGCDPYGRKISCEGSDPEDILNKAVLLAKDIKL